MFSKGLLFIFEYSKIPGFKSSFFIVRPINSVTGKLKGYILNRYAAIPLPPGALDYARGFL